MTTPNHHIAQLNVGRLIAPPEDARVAEFMGMIDKVNAAGKRSPGFVWIMENASQPGLGNTENAIAGDPRFVANLTVWEDVMSLEHFVFNTVHKQVYDRRDEWFELMADQHFVMWHVTQGHKPTLDEALERLAYKQKHGDSDYAFGWSYTKEARLYQSKSCAASSNGVSHAIT